MKELAKTQDNAVVPWDEAKLNQLIRDKIEESLTLEYKAALSLSRTDEAKREITKDVSAMANSAGGTLIYGLAEFHNSTFKHLAERIDPISRNEFSKEWLENIISQIRPRIAEIKINSIQLTSGLDHVAYAVEIPQGETAHQALDFRYYRRYNFQSTPMLDHEVRDVMNRKVHPRISFGLRFVVYPRLNQNDSSGAVVATIVNKSDVFVRYVALVVDSPITIRGAIVAYDESTWDNIEDKSSQKLRFSNHSDVPLFPQGKIEKIFEFKFASKLIPHPQKQLDHFRWQVFADGMPMQQGTFTVEEVYEKIG